MRTKRCELNFTDILIIDEADMQSVDQYIIESIWRDCAEKGNRVPHLVLSSVQSITSDLFDMNYYVIPTDTLSTVDIRYSDTDYPSNSLISEITKLTYSSYNTTDGSVLVFGTDLDNLKQTIMNTGISNVITADDVSSLYKPGRKVVVSDRRAETTISLNNFTVIIDSLLDSTSYLSITGGERQGSKYITKRRAHLRASRGSRTQDKICYRMISKRSFDNLAEIDKPAILRVPLQKIMLELMENKMDPFEVLSIYTQNELRRMYQLLIDNSAIEVTGQISSLGQFIQKIPYGIRQSLALFHWINKGYDPYQAIPILSMIDCYSQSYFTRPLRHVDELHTDYTVRLEGHYADYLSPYEGKSDIHTYGYLWEIVNQQSGDLKTWCQENSVNYKQIDEVVDLNHKVLNIINKPTTVYDPTSINQLVPILANVYSDRKFELDRSNSVIRVRYVDDKLNYYKIDSRSVNSIEADAPNHVYGLIISIIQSEYANDFRSISVSLVM